MHLLITGYNYSVVSCDDISIDQFLLLFFSIRMRLLRFHLEYHCIVLWLVRLTDCLKMGWSLRPKHRDIENTWISRKKLKYVTHFWRLINFFSPIKNRTLNGRSITLKIVVGNITCCLLDMYIKLPAFFPEDVFNF